MKKKKGVKLSIEQEQLLSEPREVKITVKDTDKTTENTNTKSTDNNIKGKDKDKEKDKAKKPNSNNPLVLKVPIPIPDMLNNKPLATVYTHQSMEFKDRHRYVDLSKPEYHPSRTIKDFVGYCFKERKYVLDSSVNNRKFISKLLFNA